MIDYYSILGLDRDCTREEIKGAYHRLAMQYHPDVSNSPDAAGKFRTITEAYEYLLKVRDEEKQDIPGRPGTGSGSNPYSVRPVEDIIASLNSQDGKVIRAAVEALGSRRFYDNSGVIGILTGYLRSPDVALRRSAITALGRLGNPSAVTDLARMLRDGDSQVRFDAVVALGNVGAQAALTYLELMEPDDPVNDAMVMNARRETIYGIKKKHRMYPPSRMCPSCGGYDIVNRAAPFKCHECGRQFAGTDERSAAGPEGNASAGGTGDRGPPINSCAFCRSQGPLVKCEYCGQWFCASHVLPAFHHCWHRDERSAPGRELYKGQGLFQSKAIKNLAAVAVLLLLLLLIGVFVIASHR